MKTIKKEVKTITIIEFDRKDMADILYKVCILHNT